MYDSLRELLSALMHDIWSTWMRHQLSVSTPHPDGSITIPADKVARWMRQMRTSYLELDEAEKESDRQQADKIIAVLTGITRHHTTGGKQ